MGTDRTLRRTWPTALAFAAGAAFAWGSLVERRMFTLRRASVPVLPDGSESLRVLHFSDLHLAPWQRDKQEWVASLAELAPDLVISTGDLMGHEHALPALERTLEPFRGIPGAFVNGSNDYFGPVAKNPLKYFGCPSGHLGKPSLLDIEGLERLLEGLGWLNLNNAAGALDVGGRRLELFGVGDAHRNWDRLDLLTQAIDELRENDPFGDGDGSDESTEPLTIGVTHAPYRRVLDSFVTHGAEVIFAGHTHGGQVRVPGFGALVTNCDIPRQQARGLSVWTHALRSAYLNVSAGLGTSIYAPVRFACPPEATLLTLTTAS